MTQHLDSLTDADIRFLDQEGTAGHAHIGWVMIGAGPPPPYPDLLEHVRSRLHLVPRHRQKLAWPPVPLARPLWVDDPRFNLDYHVRHTALPDPGSLDQLGALAGRIFSQGLDLTKPLWELWLVQGLVGGRFALINKAHHALADGASGLAITSVLFDTTPGAARVPPPDRAWVPAPEPSAAELLAASVRQTFAAPVRAARRAWEAVTDRGQAFAAARAVAAGAREIVASYLESPSPTPLNVPIGTHRHIVWRRCPLADFKSIKDILGGTVNDVYVASLSGALRRWLIDRGIRPEGLRLRAAVPVSMRARGEDWRRSQQVVEWFAPLPVDCWDPAERLRRVHGALAKLKNSHLAVGARAIAGAPSDLLAQASRLPFSIRHFNLVATNIPGPQLPLYLLDREILQIGPVGSLVEECALGVVMVSYNGMLEFGLIGDADALPDLERIAQFLDEAIDELLTTARRQRGAKKKEKTAKRGRTDSRRAGGRP
jgi:diacylglycerol O-acyltransferase / wax synthase